MQSGAEFKIEHVDTAPWLQSMSFRGRGCSVQGTCQWGMELNEPHFNCRWEIGARWCHTRQPWRMHIAPESLMTRKTKQFLNHLPLWTVKAWCVVLWLKLCVNKYALNDFNSSSTLIHFWFLTWPLTDMPGQGHNISLNDHLPKRLRMSGNGRDVFCMVKQRMASTSLCQEPLLVYPEAFTHGTEHFFNTVNTTNLVIKQSLDDDGERVKEIEKMAEAIEHDFPHLHRAVAYYRSLLDKDRYRRPYSRLAFIEAGPKATACLSNVQLGEKPVDPKPHCLQVVFHHGGGWLLGFHGFDAWTTRHPGEKNQNTSLGWMHWKSWKSHDVLSLSFHRFDAKDHC